MSAFPMESMKENWRTTPNVISSVRILLSWVPACLLVIAGLDNAALRIGAVVAFALFAATDGVDGYIARRYNLTSEWGMLLDPIGDKLLVAFSLLGVVIVNWQEPGIFFLAGTVLLIFVREIILTIQIHVRQEKVVSATFLGKVKTNVQFAMIGVWMLPLPDVWGASLRWITCAAAFVFTILSWIEYYHKYVSSRWRPVKNYY